MTTSLRARSGSARLSVSNEDLVTVREAMRGLNTMIAQLQSGEREHIILMQRGRMVARVVLLEPTGPSPLDSAERLVDVLREGLARIKPLIRRGDLDGAIEAAEHLRRVTLAEILSQPDDDLSEAP